MDWNVESIIGWGVLVFVVAVAWVLGRRVGTWIDSNQSNA